MGAKIHDEAPVLLSLVLPLALVACGRGSPAPDSPAGAGVPRAGRGGRRPGAGRKPNGLRAGVEHGRRPGFASRRPLHVTLRLRAEVGNLRGERAHRAVRDALCAAVARGRTDLRVVHYSVQSNHLHLLVEADRTAALTRGMQGLVIRIARKLNVARGRAGRVFADRYHAVALETPRQVRAALSLPARQRPAPRGTRGRHVPTRLARPLLFGRLLRRLA